MPFSSDAFTDTAGTTLASHVETGTGGSWTLHSSYSTGEFVISDATRARPNNSNTTVYYTSESPATADYSVTATLNVKSNTGSNGVAARIQTGSNNMYFMRYRQAAGLWELGKVVSGTTTVLSSTAATLTVGNDYTVTIIVSGTSITGQATGISDLTATDASISVAGRAGVRGLSGTNTTGYHLDNFSASDAAGGAKTPWGLLIGRAA